MLVMIIIILTQTQLGERALLFSSLAALKESLQDQVGDHVCDHDHDHDLLMLMMAALKESLQDQVWPGLQLRNYVGASLTDEPIIAF